MVKPNYFKFDQTLDGNLMMPNMLLFRDIQTNLNILHVIGFLTKKIPLPILHTYYLLC
jgi:hypothetical protein